MSENKIPSNKVGQEQIHNLLFGEKLSWQAIIYDLINTEQLDPWDINIGVLSKKYLEKVRNLEEANFFVTSKVLLAAALLLRLKSEILLGRDLKSLDEILFGKKEDKIYVQERIDFDDDVPNLIPRTPLPRFRKVSLQELMSALGNAINTETRRIRRVISEKQREFETRIVLPKKRQDLQGQIKLLHSKLDKIFSDTGEEKLAFSKVSGESKDDKVGHFIPLLYLFHQNKIFVEQENSFDEIWIWLKEIYEKKHAEMLEIMRKEAEEALDEEDFGLGEEKIADKIDEELEKINSRKEERDDGEDLP